MWLLVNFVLAVLHDKAVWIYIIGNLVYVSDVVETVWHITCAESDRHVTGTAIWTAGYLVSETNLLVPSFDVQVKFTTQFCSRVRAKTLKRSSKQ